MDKDEKRHAELLLLYQDGLSLIRDLKQQQWSVTYYSLLLYAGLVGVAEVARDEEIFGQWLKHTISVSTILIAAACSGVILYVQFTLRGNRKRLVAISDNHFDPDLKELPGAEKPSYITIWYNWPIWALMITITLAGALFVNWLLWD